jgi:hypothetical protein
MMLAIPHSGSDQLLSEVDSERLSQYLDLEELKVRKTTLLFVIQAVYFPSHHFPRSFYFHLYFSWQSLCDMLSADGLSRVAQRRLAWSSLEAVVKAEEEQDRARDAARAESEAALKVNGPRVGI